GVAANQLLFFKGLSLTSPIHASLIMTTLPIFVLLFSLWLNKEKPTGYKIGGVLLGASGAILLLLSGEIDWGNAVIAGGLM
ncbi:EamA family transporter, partial [Penaeicola halotolerans]|uniref:EamA family transporter n=1 Tax=Penaeicola halotolerans TaxID=2793196 RepID=UPI001CF8C913